MFCSSAHICHWRVTEPVESTRTPSRSKRMAAQLNVVIKEFFWCPVFFATLCELCGQELLTAKDAKTAQRSQRNSCGRLWTAHYDNAFGASDTTMSFPSAIWLRISMCRLRKCERARSPQ